MIGIVIVAHGRLAAEYQAAVEHVVGTQPNIKSVSIEARDDRADKEIEICQAADSVDTGEGVVLVIDLFGSTASNLSLRACRPSGRRILYGANLPMLVKLAKMREKPLQQAVDAALAAGRKYINTMEVS